MTDPNEELCGKELWSLMKQGMLPDVVAEADRLGWGRSIESLGIVARLMIARVEAAALDLKDDFAGWVLGQKILKSVPDDHRARLARESTVPLSTINIPKQHRSLNATS